MGTLNVAGTPGQNISGAGGATNWNLLAGSEGGGKIGGSGTYGYMAATGSGATRQIYGSPETPGTADYYVEMVRVAPAYLFDTKATVGVRYTTDGLNCYELVHDIVTAQVRLFRVKAGADAQIGLWNNYFDTIRLAVLTVDASTVRLTVTLDGAVQTPVNDTSADRITAAGVPGFGWRALASATDTSTKGVNIASVASDVYSGGGGTSFRAAYYRNRSGSFGLAGGAL